MELVNMLANEEIRIDSNNALLYERMNRLELCPTKNISNCFGTVAHLSGIEEEVLGYWQSVLRTPEVRKRRRSYDYIQYNQVGPGYVGPLPMTLFLTHNRNAREIGKSQAVDNVVSFFEEVADENGFRRLIHSGIYLGEFDGMEMMFHQNGTDGRFEIMPVEHYIRSMYSERVFNGYFANRKWIPVKFFGVEGRAA